MRSPYVDVVVDLDHVRASAESIRRNTGVALIPVIKADAYGLGAVQVADALATVASEFAYFYIDEARQVRRPGLALGPPLGDPAEYRELSVRPTIGRLADADRFAGSPVCIEVDTGMQRFGCGGEQLDALAARCDVQDYMTHAVAIEGVQRFVELVGHRGRPKHAACSTLLHRPEAWLDAVRPGFALYRGAVRVSTRLVALRATKTPIGYTGFETPRVGIVLCGYASGLRPGPVLINGRQQHVLEVGMNTCFVSADARDEVGDEVVLLGDELTEQALAIHHQIRPHEVLCRYTAMGPRRYRGETAIRSD